MMIEAGALQVPEKIALEGIKQAHEENKKIMHKSKIPVLDYYFDKINMILWPKFT